jgi:hypothetical protein
MIYDEASCVQIKVVAPGERSYGIYDICPVCGMKIKNYIVKLKLEAPKKCEFCEHDFGPKHPEYTKACKNCSAYSNFQLKKRMGDRQTYEWKLYNGEV